MKINIAISFVLFAVFGAALVLSRAPSPVDGTATEPSATERQDWLDAGRLQLAGMRPPDSLPNLDQD